MTNTNKKGFKTTIANWKYRINKFIKWHYKYNSLKHPFVFLRIRKGMSYIIYTGLLFFMLWCLLIESGVIVFDRNGFTTNNETLINIQPFSLVSSQVSITLIVVSICSLTGGLENKYILGKNAIDLIFKHKLIFKIYIAVIFLLTALNLYLMLKQVSNSVIFSVYIFSFVLIAIYAFNFTKLFINNNMIKYDLIHTYYKLNLKHLNKERPAKHYHYRSLEDFKNITIKYIHENNASKYNECFDVYFNLLEISLFNHRDLIQAYYTEMMDYNDFTSNIIEFCWELLKDDKKTRSLKMFNGLINMTNYYKVIVSNHIVLSNLVSKYIECIKYMQTELEIKEYSNYLFTMFENLAFELYLSSILDFSYCRLHDSDLFFWGISNTYFEKYYYYIYENKHISFSEKTRLWEEFAFRMRTLKTHTPVTHYDIDDFLNKRNRHNREEIPDDIWGEQIAILILKMYENKDRHNIELFLNNISSKTLRCFAITISTLSISDMLIRNNKRIYVYDINIDPKFAKGFLQNTNVLQLDENLDTWLKVYDLVKKYIKNDDNSGTNSIYHFSPQLSFYKDNVYYYFKSMLETTSFWQDFLEQSKIEIQQNSKIEALYKSYKNKPVKAKVRMISKTNK